MHKDKKGDGMNRIHEFIYYDKEQDVTYTIIFKIHPKTGDWLVLSLDTDDIHTAGELSKIKAGIKRYLNLISISLDNQGLSLKREYQGHLRREIEERIKKIIGSRLKTLHTRNKRK